MFFLSQVSPAIYAQKLITYDAGMGTRDPENSDVWILYQRVRAEHDGMVLYADSALLNTSRNDFTAYRKIKIELTDTTTIWGDHLYYDGVSRTLDIWDDTVILIDGATVLKTTHLMYDRNTSTAAYTTWGHTYSDGKELLSREGYYNSETKQLDIYNKVELYDSSMRLFTDTLLYNTRTHIASFVSPTHIYSDSVTIYSEYGYYHTDSAFAQSTKASRITTEQKILTCDTLYYWERLQLGEAHRNVVITDTVNDVVCTGRYGETNQQTHCSLVTDSALVTMADEADTLYVHADTIRVYVDSSRKLQRINAYYKVKFFRNDVQGMCDSLDYIAADSLMRLFKEPVLWYENYQCHSDSIDVWHDTSGVRLAHLNGRSMMEQQVDRDKFNQLKGKRSEVFFQKGDPTHADILGNAQMVYYITEEDSVGRQSLIGVNTGVGSDMRIYFESRQPWRLTTYGSPDMSTYPLSLLPDEQRRLPDFKWMSGNRPRKPEDVFLR
ncbi:MAG: hypothetical protein KBT04_07025 [Bacteroidales bacterium]|nr:hypothetical protein [Candidatus Colimorpha onthohippi]